MNQNESLLDIVVLLYKWRKRILLGTLIAGIVTALISLTLDNYYKSSTLFYAASPDMTRPLPIGDAAHYTRIYGNGEDLDRLLSIAKSNTVNNYLIEEFNLYDHYEIDSTSLKGKSKMLLKLGKLYSINKTKFDAINLAVEDKDPKMAAQMANAARIKIEGLAQALIKNSQKVLLDSYKSKIESKELKFKILTDSLYNTRINNKIFNTASQGEAYSSSLVELKGSVQNLSARIKFLEKINGPRDSINYLKAKKEGKAFQLLNIEAEIQNYNNGYPTIISIERERRDYGDQLTIDKERLTQLESVYHTDIKGVHVIETAEVPVIKSRPKRSIIVIGISALVFLLSSLMTMLMDQLNKNNWREKFNNV